jgi:hypothetical protein
LPLLTDIKNVKKGKNQIKYYNCLKKPKTNTTKLNRHSVRELAAIVWLGRIRISVGWLVDIVVISNGRLVAIEGKVTLEILDVKFISQL